MIIIKRNRVICCGEFSEACLVAKKLEKQGFVMAYSGKSPYEWLKETFGDRQFGICFVIPPNKEVFWCHEVYAMLSSLRSHEVEAIYFLEGQKA